MDFEAPRPADLLARYRAIRALTHRLIEPLTAEDMLVQSMPSASPTKWHLAHTTWFFETFVLQETADYCLFDPEFNYLFNSYYNTIGDRISRLSRGLLSRPTLDTVLAYRRHVDAAMERLLAADAPARLLQFTEIGLHHEQQHQELILTDVKHALGSHPLLPAYRAGTKPEARAEGPRGAAEPNPSLGSRLGLRPFCLTVLTRAHRGHQRLASRDWHDASPTLGAAPRGPGRHTLRPSAPPLPPFAPRCR